MDRAGATPLLRRMPLAGACAFALLVFAPGAHAAFAPELSVNVSDGQAGKVPIVGASLRQTASETPVKRLTLRFPPGYAWNDNFDARPCSKQLALALACGNDQIGVVSGRSPTLGPVSGPVYLVDLGSGPQPVMILTALGGTLRATVPASLSTRANGARDVTFTPLPSAPLTSLDLTLFRGGAGLVRNPAECGRYVVEAKLTSHRSELAVAQTAVNVVGCGSLVSPLSLFPRKFRPRKSAAVLSWTAAVALKAAKFRVERRGKKGWKRIGRVLASGAEGPNQFRFDGVVRGKRLRPGSYRFVLTVPGNESRRTVGFRILPKR